MDQEDPTHLAQAQVKGEEMNAKKSERFAIYDTGRSNAAGRTIWACEGCEVEDTEDGFSQHECEKKAEHMGAYTAGPWMIDESTTDARSRGYIRTGELKGLTEEFFLMDARIRELTDERNMLRDALKMVLPLAESYLRKAPGHPDNAKLEDARAAIQSVSGGAS